MTLVATCDHSRGLKARSAGRRAALAFECFRLTFDRRYSEEQPRVPAGEPGAGQWMEGDGGDSSPNASILPVAGFQAGDENRTVQDFVSAYCTGKIRSVMPGQFLEMTIGQVQSLAKSGNAAARTCIKLLGRDEYRK